uniref:Uncharacterized protein n=1 Tax=Amphilophus citrinellus TaxID=61819 RepID=A0A3Q0RLY3_AMPCI
MGIFGHSSRSTFVSSDKLDELMVTGFPEFVFRGFGVWTLLVLLRLSQKFRFYSNRDIRFKKYTLVSHIAIYKTRLSKLNTLQTKLPKKKKLIALINSV